jgi:hypothetical protein
MQDITNELLASGSPTVKFEQEGDVRKIKITNITKQQETDFDTGEPVTWPNGQPKYQYVVTGTVDGDEARLFIKGYMVDALREALRKANVQAGDTLSGGTLTVKWDSTDEPRRKGMQGARRYVAKFEPAPVGTVDDDLI